MGILPILVQVRPDVIFIENIIMAVFGHCVKYFRKPVTADKSTFQMQNPMTDKQRGVFECSYKLWLMFLSVLFLTCPSIQPAIPQQLQNRATPFQFSWCILEPPHSSC